MYEESWVPERIPGGGGFSIKNMSLRALFEEHEVGHNIFTATNNHYPLMRYLGCHIKFYQSSNIDYVATYSNTWPLESNMQMYNTMQPSIHLMMKNKIIIPSKRTKTWKRPYKKKFIPPPTQMKNQWYFQKDLAKTPLFMLRTSSISIDNYYVGNRQLSTNITIHSLNYAVIQNRKFGQPNPWYARTLGTQFIYLWATTQERDQTDIYKTPLNTIIPLTNVMTYTDGQTYEEWKRTHTATSDNPQKWAQDKTIRGNPFMGHYLRGEMTVFSTTLTLNDLENKTDSDMKSKTLEEFKTTHQIQVVDIVNNLRYNPYKDKGKHNSCYFLSAKNGEHGWDSPSNPDLRNDNLPLWLLLYGYSDFIKKSKLIQHVDEDYILVINSLYTNPQKQIIIPISNSFYEGNSPYETTPNPIDFKRWYLTYQMQQEASNDICMSGPGTPKLPPTEIAEAKIKYNFYFKWGGEQPPMATISDPSEQPWYPIPNNNNSTNSLQNPETAPEYFLYSFDERRGTITKTASERIQKDWETKEIPFLSTEYRFSEKTSPQIQEAPSEEEEENLFQLLNKQRLEQQQLKLRITQTLKKLQKLE